MFIASTSTSTDWYKFKVTEKRPTVFRVNATDMSSGSLTITAYAGSKKIGTQTVSARTSKDFTITNGTTYGKADAGTYYVWYYSAANNDYTQSEIDSILEIKFFFVKLWDFVYIGVAGA